MPLSASGPPNHRFKRRTALRGPLIVLSVVAAWGAQPAQARLTVVPSGPEFCAGAAADLETARGTQAALDDFVERYRGCDEAVSEARAALDELKRESANAAATTPSTSAVPSRDDSPIVSQAAPARIWTVDDSGGADFGDLAAAVQTAQAGERILVRPGIYGGGMTVDKALEIVGDGPRGDIVIEATGSDVFWWKAKGGRIAGLTLRQQGGGRFYGIDVQGGSVLIENNDISSESLAAIAIREGADPIVRANVLADSPAGAIGVFDAAKGLIEDNDMTGNGLAAITVHAGGDPVVRNNRINGSDAAGVFVQDGGQGRIENNEFRDNPIAGVVVAGEASRTMVENNRFVDGTGEAPSTAISVRDGAAPTVRGNTIEGRYKTGIFVDAANGTIEGNTVLTQGLAGVGVIGSGTATVANNTVRNADGVGIVVGGGARPQIEGNELSDNAGAGLTIEAGGRPNVGVNTYRDNSEGDIYVLAGGELQLSDPNADVRTDSGAGPVERTGSNTVASLASLGSADGLPQGTDSSTSASLGDPAALASNDPEQVWSGAMEMASAANGTGDSRSLERAVGLMLDALACDRNGSAQRMLVTERGQDLDDATRLAIQRRLQNRGLYRGALDGDFGPGTRAALSRWRTSVGTCPLG